MIPAGPAGPEGATKNVVSLNTAWYNLMARMGLYGPKRVQNAGYYLDQVDRITGISTKRRLPI